MDEQEFDQLIRAHVTGASRRGVVAGLGSGLLAALSLALVGSAGVGSAAAKGKSRANANANHQPDGNLAEAEGKKKRRRRRKKKHKQNAPVSPPPPPVDSGSPPPPIGPGSCPIEAGGFEFTKGRMAQTFLPPQGGQLTQATVYLVDNPSFSLIFEIRKVDAAGVPTNNVLASASVLGIQSTSFNDPPQAVTATFATPATLTLGQPYALSVRGPGNKLYFVGTGGGPGDGCQDGRMFRDEFAIGDFVAFADGTDMAYALTVV